MTAARDLEELPARRAPRFLRALNAAFSRVPVWLIAAAVPVASGAVAALPWWRWLDGAIGAHYAPGSLIAALDENFRFDHRREMDALGRATSAGGAVLAFLAMLGGAFTAGGWLQILLERTEGHSVLRFFFGGARYFWRFARVLLITLPLLALVGWTFHGMPWEKFVQESALGLEDGRLEELGSERAALWVGWARDGLHALGFALVILWGVHTRTRLALQDGRSAVLAGLATAANMLRHPVRTLRTSAAVFLATAVGVAALGSVARGLDRGMGEHSSRVSVAALLAVGLAGLLWRSLGWGAQYAAAVEAARELVPPSRKTQLWEKAAGAPGGPQYPVGGDELGVSV